MASTLRLSILSPERRLLEDIEASELTVTTSEGEIQVLPGHAPMISTLEAGIFNCRTARGTSIVGVISGGFLEVQDNRVSVMAETLELPKEIDLSRAREAQKAAEEALRGAELSEHQFKQYQLQLQRALIRQQLAGKDHPH